VKNSYENNLYGDIRYKQYDLYDDNQYVQLRYIIHIYIYIYTYIFIYMYKYTYIYV
jgi:hypothetical protein